jgi:hypothetical protein
MATGEVVGAAIAGAFWIAIARALTIDTRRGRAARIAVIALTIPCLLFAAAWIVGAQPNGLSLLVQLASTAFFWAFFGRPAHREERDERGGEPTAAEQCAACSMDLAAGANACPSCGAPLIHKPASNDGRGRSRTPATL